QNDFEAKDIVVKDNVISDIGDDAMPAAFNLPIIDLSGDDYVIPGFIDIHIHGSKGADVIDGDVDALAVISKSLYTQGVTRSLASTMTAANEQILKEMRA
ncbi:N-acetylglucosamine-6-phosphate deacetylase, partial [Francisella tularensis subsp. holarctica]|nr:N-acetylglucosamine-6-phosphate deacetylase [Francisella tularensis subsp. holarctica]